MGAVAAGIGYEIGAVVQDQRDATRLGDGAHQLDRMADVVVGCVFQAELEGGDVTGV
jgi:hypothetical protein